MKNIVLKKFKKMTTTISDESIKSQTDKVCRMASDTHFPFVCFATEIDGTHKNDLVDVSQEIFSKIAATVEQQHPNASFMLIAAGPKSCAVFVKAEKAVEWLSSCGISPSSLGTQQFAIVPLENPMKDKEQISGAAFAYLRKNGLMEEEEETPPFDLNDY